MVDVGAGPAAYKALETGQIFRALDQRAQLRGLREPGAKFRYISTPQVEPVFGWSLIASAANLEAAK